jgi:CRP/FNR family cyclic AMP-dependent transcriptional regulator
VLVSAHAWADDPSRASSSSRVVYQMNWRIAAFWLNMTSEAELLHRLAAAIMLRFPMAKIENDQRPGAKTGVRRFDPAAFLATTAKGRAVSTHRKGKVLFAQGDASDAVLYLKKGKVKVTVLSKQGKEAVVALLSADEFFGEGCLIGQPKRLATATAMTDCVTMRVETMEMQRALDRQPSFSRMFLSHILTRGARVEEDLVDQLFNSTEKRLARLLLLLANFGNEGRPEPVVAKMSGDTCGNDWHNPIPREPFYE